MIWKRMGRVVEAVMVEAVMAVVVRVRRRRNERRAGVRGASKCALKSRFGLRQGAVTALHVSHMAESRVLVLHRLLSKFSGKEVVTKAAR
jgi:hypothetical protein